MVDTVMEMVRGAPSPAVRHLVRSYIGYRYEGFEPGTHQGLPGRDITLIVSLSDPIEISSMPDPTDAPVAMRAIASGLAATPVTVTHDGNQFGVQLELSVFGTRSLFGMPASELAAVVVDLHDLMGPFAGELNDRIRVAATWADRFAVIDDVLERVQRDAAAPAPEIGEAWRQILASEGNVEIGQLARDIGWSRRHLAQTFRSELGLPPKTMARIVRFERAKNLIRSLDAMSAVDPSPSPPRSRPRSLGWRPSGLADVAAICGYFDQAHLTRDFRGFAGCSPTAWIAEELPSVQDEDVLLIGS